MVLGLRDYRYKSESGEPEPDRAGRLIKREKKKYKTILNHFHHNKAIIREG